MKMLSVFLEYYFHYISEITDKEISIHSGNDSNIMCLYEFWGFHPSNLTFPWSTTEMHSCVLFDRTHSLFYLFSGSYSCFSKENENHFNL